MDSLHKQHLNENSTTRQSRLIRYITYELVIVCVIILFPYTYAKLWLLVAIISNGGILALLNLWLLTYSKNTNLCGHILIAITFITITTANYLVWGVGTFYSLWFYVVPLLAASLVGWTGLIIYSSLALLMIILFATLSIPPYYHLTHFQLTIIQWANHLFAYLIMVTTVINLMLENKRYEKKLHNKNYLLQVEKDKFQHLAHFDQLTNLPNRHNFKQRLQEIIDTLGESDCATVFFMDLDNLKTVNDRYGHDAGDQLILQSAKRLQKCFRKEDFVARLGGDEFTAIVIHSKKEKTPQSIATRIIHEFEHPFLLDNIEYRCTISMGLSNCPHDTKTVTELMSKADKAMYAAKKIAGSSYCGASAFVS